MAESGTLVEMVCASPITRGPDKGRSATGTWAGYKRHRRAGEPACELCLRGAAERGREWHEAHLESERKRIREYLREWRKTHDSWREANRRWAAANPEKVKEYARRSNRKHRAKRTETARRYRAENRERTNGYSRRWRQHHPEQMREATANWLANNPEYMTLKRERRRARQAGVLTIEFSSEELRARLSMFAGCWMCGGPADSVDHVKPLAAGGPHILANLRPACTSCNSRKGSKWPLFPDVMIGDAL